MPALFQRRNYFWSCFFNLAPFGDPPGFISVPFRCPWSTCELFGMVFGQRPNKVLTPKLKTESPGVYLKMRCALDASKGHLVDIPHNFTVKHDFGKRRSRAGGSTVLTFETSEKPCSLIRSAIEKLGTPRSLTDPPPPLTTKMSCGAGPREPFSKEV